LSLPESIRRFTNYQIENKEPIRREMGKEIAEWIAAGNKIHVLPGLTFPPKPAPKAKPAPKPPKQRGSVAIYMPWEDEAEIAKLRQLRSDGVTHSQIARILRAEFGNDRTPQMVKNALKRDQNGTLGTPENRKAWSAEEESWLYFLAKYDFTAREIANAMNQFLGGRVRNRDSVRQYALSRRVSMKADPRCRRKDG